MSRSLRWILLALAASLPGCANLNLYGDDEMNRLGAEAYVEATKDYPVITGTKDAQMVARVAQRIATSCEADFEWEFKLLKADDVVNAFCLPGGKIAVYTGILAVTQNESALAAVVGHEVAHAVRKHGAKRMTQETLFGVALAAAEAGLSMTEMAPETKNLTLGALGLGGQVGLLLPFSRDHESEADIEGLRYAIRAGYDPNEAPKLWERMAKLSGGSSTPAWLSTHPASNDRAAALRAAIPQLVAQEKGWKAKPKAPTPSPTPSTTPAKAAPKK
ncbi:MAG: M48 family metallopeptidase [Planctomycetota bacterium]